MRRTINVLFTAVCGWPTHATIKSLRESKKYKYHIVGVDINPNPAARDYCDEIYSIPRSGSHNYIQELVSVLKRCNIDVLVPLISEDINPIYNNLDLFEEIGVKVLLSGRDSKLLVANDKMKLYQYLTENDINVMPKSVEYNEDTLDDDLKSLGYPDLPIAIKLKDGCGGVGFKILDEYKAKNICNNFNRDSRVNPYVGIEQVREIGKSGRCIMQTYLGGRELGVLSMVDHGRTVYALCHDNYDMQYATTTDCELVKNNDAENIVRKVNSLLRLDGNIGYDFKRDENGKLYLLEINPRISATVCLANKAGVNIVEMGILHALGLPIDEDITPKYGLRMKRVYGTIYTYEGEPYYG